MAPGLYLRLSPLRAPAAATALLDLASVLGPSWAGALALLLFLAAFAAAAWLVRARKANPRPPGQPAAGAASFGVFQRS